MIRAIPWQQLGRFGVTGVLATATHVLVVFLFLRFIAYNPPLANGIAFCVATAGSFVLHSKWSFARPMGGTTFAKFLTVSLLGCALTVIVSAIADAHGYSPAVGVACVVLTVPPLTYVLHRSWTYRA